MGSDGLVSADPIVDIGRGAVAMSQDDNAKGNDTATHIRLTYVDLQ